MGEDFLGMSDFRDELRFAEDLYEQMRNEVEIVRDEHERIKEALRVIVRQVEKLRSRLEFPERIDLEAAMDEARDFLR